MFTSRQLTATALLLVGLAAAGAAAAQGRQENRPQHGHGGGFALDFAEIDADGNDSVTVAELQARATDRVGGADANGDGNLDRTELIALMPERGGGFFRPFAPSRSEMFADRMLAMMGATETGQIAVVDLVERRVNDTMAALDTDRDGAISAAEAERPQGRMAGRRGEHGNGQRPRF